MKLKRICTLVSLAFCCSFMSVVAQGRTDEYIERSKEAYKNQRYDDAITWALKVIDTDAEDVDALWLCAASYQSLGIYSEAEVYEKKLTEYGVWSVLLNRGMLCGKQGYDEEAIDYFTRSIELKSDNPKAYNGRGGINVLHFRVNEAIADLNRSIELFEKKGTEDEPSKETYLPYYNLGVMYQLNEDYDAAEIYYKKAMHSQPEALELLGTLEYLKQKRNPKYKPSKDIMKRLVAYYDENLSTNRWSALDYYRRGECYENLGNKYAAKCDYQRALELFSEIIDDSPKASIYIKYRANLYEDLGQQEDALRDYRRVLQLNPDEKDVQRSIDKLAKK